jgi:hypothetical protein
MWGHWQLLMQMLKHTTCELLFVTIIFDCFLLEAFPTILALQSLIMSMFLTVKTL